MQLFNTSQIYVDLRRYLKDTLQLTDEKVRRAYIDNIPVPSTYPYIYITILGIKRNSTNARTQDILENISTIASYILDVQLDFYGQDSFDLALELQLLFRDIGIIEQFAQYSDILIPLYADDITQYSSTDENGNFMVRNTMILHFNLQVKKAINQLVFDKINIDVKNVDNI